MFRKFLCLLSTAVFFIGGDIMAAQGGGDIKGFIEGVAEGRLNDEQIEEKFSNIPAPTSIQEKANLIRDLQLISDSVRLVNKKCELLCLTKTQEIISSNPLSGYILKDIKGGSIAFSATASAECQIGTLLWLSQSSDDCAKLLPKGVYKLSIVETAINTLSSVKNGSKVLAQSILTQVIYEALKGTDLAMYVP